MGEIRFTVYGKPQTAGSKRAFPFKRANGKLGVAVSDDNPKSKDWKVAIADAALREHSGGLLEGPLELSVTFAFERPKGHYRGANRSNGVKANAPACHAQRPDATKLIRCIEDALNGVLWSDDSQIVFQHAYKCWDERGYANITIRPLAS